MRSLTVWDAASNSVHYIDKETNSVVASVVRERGAVSKVSVISYGRGTMIDEVTEKINDFLTETIERIY